MAKTEKEPIRAQVRGGQYGWPNVEVVRELKKSDEKFGDKYDKDVSRYVVKGGDGREFVVHKSELEFDESASVKPDKAKA